MTCQIDPPDTDRAAWRIRQDNLPTNRIPDNLEPHEVRFYERFLGELGQRVVLIPRNPFIPSVGRTPSNDFIWLTNGSIYCELKANNPRYATISEAIRRAVLKADIQGVIKNNFVIDLGQTKLTAKLQNQLATFNQKNQRVQIRSLWVVDSEGLQKICLK